MKPMLPEFGQCGELFHTPSGTAFADIPLKTTGKPSPYAAPIRSSAERARGLPGRQSARFAGRSLAVADAIWTVLLFFPLYLQRVSPSASRFRAVGMDWGGRAE
jgi:hypothetical protein